MRLRNTPAFLGAFIVLSLVSVGCATKKHVREAIAPGQNQVNQTQSQVSTLQKQTDENKQSIADLDRQGPTADANDDAPGRQRSEAARGPAAAHSQALNEEDSA